MDTRQFLASVLPEEGPYCAREIGQRTRNYFVDDLDALSDRLQRISARGADAYYVTGSLTPDNVTAQGKRSAAAAYITHKRCFYLDIDIGKERNSYPDAASATAALTPFLQKLGLPPTLIVRSGVGLHLYWVLDRALERDVWNTTAAAFKAYTLASGLIIDPSVPADAAQILRAPGTTHQKTGRPVRLLREGRSVTHDDFLKATGQPADTLASVPEHLRGIGPSVDLQASTDYPPSSAATVAEHCQFVRTFRDTGFPEAGSEPLWHDAIGAIKYCDDGPELAHQWSSAHPDYSEGETTTKLDNWTVGPATCASLQRHGLCDGCEYAGQITAPIELGRSTSRMNVESGAPLTEPTWPENFGWDDAKKQMYQDIWRQDDGEWVRDRVHFTRSKFFVETRVRDEDSTWALAIRRYKYDDADDTETFRVNSKLIAKPSDLASRFAEQEIYVTGKHGAAMLSDLLKTYGDELRQSRVEVTTVPAMGWYNTTDPDANRKDPAYPLTATEFVLGNQALTADDEYDILLGSRVAQEWHQTLATSGTAEDYWKLVNDVYNNPDSLIYQLVICATLASPLAPLFGQAEYRGTPFALVSRSGYGKSTSTQAALAMYCNPDLLTVSGNPSTGITPRALQNHLASLGCIPTLLDEVTLQPGPILSELAYMLSMGKPRVRVGRDGKPTQSDERWASNSIIASNRSVFDTVAQDTDGNNEDVADAVQNRIFELNYERLGIKKDSIVGDVERSITIMQKLGRQYGAAGRGWLRHLVANKFRITDTLNRTHTRLKQRSGDAAGRFYDYAMAGVIVAAQEARKVGMIQFDLAQLINFMVHARAVMHDTKEAQQINRADLFARYINQHLNQIIVTKRYPGGKRGRVSLDSYEMPLIDLRGEPIGRLATEDRRAYLAKGPLMDWCRQHHIDFARLVSVLDDASYFEHDPSALKANKGKRNPARTATARVSLTAGVTGLVAGKAMRPECFVLDYDRIDGRGALTEVTHIAKEASKRAKR